MQNTHTRNRMLSILLAAVMLFTLLPIAALAANATGTATATQGTSSIFVNLSEGSQFSDDGAAVGNPANWTLGVTGGSQTISSVVKTGATSATITLSAPIAAGNSFTLNAAAAVFATGTEPFTAPISVTVYVPTPATGTATAVAGTKDISVTLTYGSFGAANAVQHIPFWALGGTSAAGNPIAAVTRVDTIHATVTLTNNIALGDVYTLTASQNVFVNIAVAPFAEPLSVAVSAPVDNVCAINGAPYPTLDAAITAATSMQTITVLKDITHTSAVTIDGKNLTFDLTNGNIIIRRSTGTALTVKDCIVTLTGEGFLDVEGGTCGVSADNATVTVRNATAATGSAVYAVGSGVITVEGDAIGGGKGAYVSGNGSSATIDGDAKSTGINGVAVQADTGGQIHVRNAISSGANSSGAKATGTGTGIRITNNAQGTEYGVWAQNGGAIGVNGNVTADGGGSVGAWANTGGHITIDGSITSAGDYIKVGTTTKTAADREAAPTPVDGKNYDTYTDGTNIVLVQQEPVSDGRPAVQTNSTTEITQSGAKLSGRVTADGGKPVTERGFVYGSAENPTVETSTKITAGSGTGDFTATLSGLTAGARYYVRAYAVNENGTGYGANESFYTATTGGNACAIGTTEYPELSDALAAVTDSTPVTIRLLRTITEDTPISLTDRQITFDLSGYNLTLDASGTSASATLTVEGGSVGYTGSGSFAVIGSHCAVYAIAASIVTVSSAEITAAEGQSAVYVGGEGSLVTVNGPVTATGTPGGTGVQAESGGKAVVNGSITAGRGVKSTDEDSLVTVSGTITAGYEGVSVRNKGKAVTGDIVVSRDNGTGVYADGGGEATVNGSVSVNAAGTGIRVYMQDDGEISKVTVNGSVSAIGYGVSVYGGDVHITGSVVSQNSYGVHTQHPAAVTIDGEITAPAYLNINGSDRTKGSKNSIDGNGYWVYDGWDGSVVRVGNHTTPVLPTVSTENALQAEVTKSGALLRGSVSAAGSSPVTAYGFVWNTSGNPTITGSSSIAGTGEAGYFTADLAGQLLPGTTYYVRAFATSGAGTAYGQERIFTTRAADPPGAPVSLHYLAHDSAVELLWDAPNDGGSPILYYEIMHGNDLVNGTWIDIGNVSSYTWSGLINGQSTAFNLRAVNAIGPGERSYISPTPNIPTVPGAPRDLHASPGNGYVSVSWNAPWFNGYRNILDYQVSMDGANWITPEYSTSHTFRNLANGVTYTFCVRALNVIGAGEYAFIRSAPETSGGGSVGGGPSALPAYQATVEGGGTHSLPVNVNSSAGSATVDLGSIADEIPGGGKTIVTIPSIPRVNACTIKFPASALSGEGDSALIVDTERGEITLPDNMLTGTGLQGNIGVTIGSGDPSSLSPKVQEAIGGRPLLQLLLTVDGIQTAWNNPAAPITVTIPYTPTKEELENPEGIVIWYIDGAVNMVCVPNGRYDPETGTVTFTTTHFSYYAAGYNKVSFRDVAAAAWYSDAVSFIAARGITGGTGNGSYSPDARLTRGEFIVMLMKAYEIEADENLTNNFSDAGNTYYTGYLAAAKRLGITAGVGNNLYAPGREVTRQEMFTLLYNALNIIGKLPRGNSGKTLSDFSDADQIASWAKDAMTLLVKTGAIGGSNGALAPLSTTTRAEMAQMLYNLLGK